MSKSINVYPDHYKLAGGERRGQTVVNKEPPSSRSEQQAKERWVKRERRKQPK